MTPPEKPGIEGDMPQILVYSSKSVESYKLIVWRRLKSYIKLNLNKTIMEPTTFTDNATEKWFWILGMYWCKREGDGGVGEGGGNKSRLYNDRWKNKKSYQ